MIRVLILNQCTYDSGYEAVDKSMRETWQTVKHPNVKIINYYGGGKESLTKFYPDTGNLIVQADDIVTTEVEEGQATIKDPRGEKFIRALGFCLSNFDFDFIQRISCTSYVDVTKMVKYLTPVVPHKVYNGARNMYMNRYYFVAGHCVLLSKDVVEVLVNHKDDYLNSTYPEDLAAGKLILHDLKYTDFTEQLQVSFYELVHSQNLHIPEQDSRYCYKTKKEDTKAFYEIHKALY